MGRISGLLIPTRGDFDQQGGVKATVALEQANSGSCATSQECDSALPGGDIDAATQALIRNLNAAQVKLGTTLQCEINGMLYERKKLDQNNSL